MRVRPGLEAARKELVEVTAGDDVVAGLILLLQKRHQLLGLRDLSCAVVVGFQMQIYQNQLTVTVLDGQTAHQKAALEIHRGDRPGEGAGQRNTFRRADFVIRGGKDAAVDLSHRREGNRHKGAGIVQRKSGYALCQGFRFICPVGTGGVYIDLLQKQQIRIGLFQSSGDSPEIGSDGVTVFGPGPFPSGEGKIRVLKGIDLDIYKNEFMVILGESGCGKSTLVNIVAGMDRLTEGSLIIDGKDFSRPTEAELTRFRREYLGFVFQQYNLMPNLTALENVQYIAELVKNPMASAEAIRKVGLTDRSKNFPSMLSGGQQQRVSIARAIVKNPKIIFADEPTAALDYQTSIEVLDVFEQIVQTQGSTVVMITHNPEIARMADRVVKLRNGRVSSIRINLRPAHATELVW